MIDAAQLLGAWTLRSSVQTRNGVPSPTYGTPPGGQIQYTADGRMSAFLMDPDWAATGENATRQYDRFFAYAGRFELVGDDVHHHIDFCTMPRRIGTVFVRNVGFIDADTIELTTAPESSPSGAVYVTRLVWTRCAAGA